MYYFYSKFDQLPNNEDEPPSPSLARMALEAGRNLIRRPASRPSGGEPSSTRRRRGSGGNNRAPLVLNPPANNNNTHPNGIVGELGTRGGMVRSSARHYYEGDERKNFRVRAPPVTLPGDSRRIFKKSNTSGFCVSPGCSAFIIECGGRSVGGRNNHYVNSTPSQAIQQAIGLSNNNVVWRKLSWDDDGRFHSSACDELHQTTSGVDEMIVTVRENAIFPHLGRYPDLDDVRNLAGSNETTALLCFLRGRNTATNGTTAFSDTDRQFIHFVVEAFEAGMMNLPNGFTFTEWFQLIAPEFASRGGTHCVHEIITGGRYFSPKIQADRVQRNLPEIGSIANYQQRTQSNPQRRREEYDKIRYAIELLLLEAKNLRMVRSLCYVILQISV